MTYTEWYGYLLDDVWRDEMTKKGIKLNTLLHSEIIKHAKVGPIKVEAVGYPRAHKALFKILKDWGLPGTHRRWSPYLHVKNFVDDREKDQLSKADLTQAVQTLAQRMAVSK